MNRCKDGDQKKFINCLGICHSGGKNKLITHHNTWNEVSQILVDHQEYHSEVQDMQHPMRSSQFQIQDRTTCYLMLQPPLILSITFQPRRQHTSAVPSKIELFAGMWIVDLSDPLYVWVRLNKQWWKINLYGDSGEAKLQIITKGRI